MHATVNYALDLANPVSRTAQIVALNTYLQRIQSRYEYVTIDSLTGVHSILSLPGYNKMTRINALLRETGDPRLINVVDKWPVDSHNVLRAIFQADETRSGAKQSQDVPFAEAYLVTILESEREDVDWKSVIANAVKTRRVTLLDAALQHATAEDTASVFGRTTGSQARHDARVVARYFRETTGDTDARRVRQHLVRYMNIRSQTDPEFRAELERLGISRIVRRTIMERE